MGLFLNIFLLPFLILGPSGVTLRELVYRLVAKVKSLAFFLSTSIGINVPREGIEGFIVAALTFIFSFDWLLEFFFRISADLAK